VTIWRLPSRAVDPAALTAEEFVREGAFEHLLRDELMRVAQSRAEVVEALCSRAWGLQAPERRNQLMLIYPHPAGGAWLPVVASWAWAEVAHCVAGVWPDCGSIPCGFPCGGFHDVVR
jgi:hypothetical protein